VEQAAAREVQAAPEVVVLAALERAVITRGLSHPFQVPPQTHRLPAHVEAPAAQRRHNLLPISRSIARFNWF
jgi:hypothetical protein